MVVMNPDWLAVTRRSHKEAGWRGPKFPGRTRSQTPKGRFYRSPWQRTSSHPPPVSKGGNKINECETTEESVNSDKCKMKSEERFFFFFYKGTWGKVHSERKRVSQNLSEGGRFVGVDGEDYPAGMARRNETKKERKELNISCKPTVNWYKIYTGRNYYDNHIQPTASNESTGVLTKLIEPRVLHIKGCFPPLGDFTHCI